MEEKPFKAALRQSIGRHIRDARADGVVGMSLSNLIQVVRPPRRELAGVPQGTNAGYYFVEMFREICAEPQYRNFILV